MSLLTMAPGVRSLARCRWQPDWWRTRSSRVFGQAGAIRGTRSRAICDGAPGRALWDYANDRRGEGPEPRHRCGVLAARRAAQRHREVRRERLPRRRDLGPDEPAFSEQQHRRRVGGPGHHERQHPPEPVRLRRGPGWPHHSEQAVVLRGRAEAQPPI